MWHDDSRFAVVARGHAKGTAGQRRPRVRAYADPVTMLVLAAIDDALNSAGSGVRLRDRTDVGVISISAGGPRGTLRQLATTMIAGHMSPTRFAGAGPGFLAGMACIDYRFHGPSLVLTCSPEVGAPVAAHVADSWLADGSCTYVLVNEHRAGLCEEAHDVETHLLKAAK